jgi:hypothetical protein
LYEAEHSMAYCSKTPGKTSPFAAGQPSPLIVVGAELAVVVTVKVSVSVIVVVAISVTQSLARMSRIPYWVDGERSIRGVNGARDVGTLHECRSYRRYDGAGA